MLEPYQIIIVCVIAFFTIFDEFGPQIGLNYPAIIGPITGLLLGDITTGCVVGGTLQLMSLGVAAVGGSSIPKYGWATIIGTGVMVGTGRGLEAGLAIAVPVGMLAVQLDILFRLANGVVVRRSLKAVEEHDFKKANKLLLLGPVLYGIEAAGTVLIAVTLGSTFINQILDATPAWVTNGLTLSGALLPVVGFSMLLKFMPVGKHINYVLFGFVMAAYLKIPIMGIAIVGFGMAFMFYKNSQKHEVRAVAATDATGVIGDDEDE
ncbi:PTS mannose/fructose/sorbose/N-acetylgalactosamine transporter subunit IIC [Enterococcus diestrammenae]|uniref:PTS mannose/fructose/sorbose/N-acetylgalactosamine transporter subunit IIC n=1 Tax=Enterococcus diestrammenae TaxID=1155073 RepID=UPI001957FBB6